jgi:hypothetical protein
MRLKFSWLLPIGQVAVAILLLHWGEQLEISTYRRMRYDTLYVSTPALVCAGINGPARFVASLSHFFYRYDHAPPTVFGLDLERAFFFLGVAILWFLVGRTIDTRRTSKGPPATWGVSKFVLVGAPLALMGASLLYVSVIGLFTPGRLNNEIGSTLNSVLLLFWSLALLSIPVLALSRRLRIPVSKS